MHPSRFTQLPQEKKKVYLPLQLMEQVPLFDKPSTTIRGYRMNPIDILQWGKCTSISKLITSVRIDSCLINNLQTKTALVPLTEWTCHAQMCLHDITHKNRYSWVFCEAKNLSPRCKQKYTVSNCALNPSKVQQPNKRASALTNTRYTNYWSLFAKSRDSINGWFAVSRHQN